MAWRPPRSTLFPYTTLFRSSAYRTLTRSSTDGSTMPIMETPANSSAAATSTDTRRDGIALAAFQLPACSRMGREPCLRAREGRLGGRLPVPRPAQKRLVVELCEHLDDIRVELPTGMVEDLSDRLLYRPRRLVRAGVRESIEHVRRGHDPSRERDLLASKAAGVASAVPALVVGQRDALGHDKQRATAAGQDLGADRRVRLHLLELPVTELARLEQDRVGNSDLADVVQRRGAPDQLNLLVGQPEPEIGRHTSELQSLRHLVCRLLLEKK